MTRMLAVAFGLALTPSALACPGSECACGDAETKEETAAAKPDPSHCARKPELVGNNCSYTTGMMAERVLEEGKTYTYTGSLTPSTNDLPSRVAAPFTVGPGGEIHLVANEVVDRLMKTGKTARVELEGRVLEVDGVTYFVANAFEPMS